jgi:hypothetical protein
VPVLKGHVHSLVAKVATEVVARMAITKKTKDKYHTYAEKAIKAAHTETMKWLPFIASFVLRRCASSSRLACGPTRASKKFI